MPVSSLQSSDCTTVRLSGRGSRYNAAWSRQIAIDCVGALDAFAVVLSGVALTVVHALSGHAVPPMSAVVHASLVAALICHIWLRDSGFYDVSRIHDIDVSPNVIFTATAIAGITIVGMAPGITHYNSYAFAFVSAWIGVAFAAVLTSRLVSQTVLRRLAATGRFDVRVAIFGNGRIAARLQEQIGAAATSGIHFAGLYDDRPTERTGTEFPQLAGSLDDLISIGREGLIDKIIIALPQDAERRIADIARRLEQLPLSIHIVTHVASDLVDEGSAHRVSNLGPIGLIDVKPKPLADWGLVLKRIEDSVLSLVFATLALPVMAIIAIAIKADSRGPVLFRQRRRGLNQKAFYVLKFRTMTVAEDGPVVVQASLGDVRVTRIGRWLRRSSLDELPQLFNVLRGEMSLVGPRPHALVHDQQWEQWLERYANRHQVKPGITGLAQICGHRGESTAPEQIRARVDRDLHYITTWSVSLDLWILWRTIWAVAGGKNAY